MAWLPGFERAPQDSGHAGLPYISCPWKLVLHTTETTNYDACLASYRQGRWPHATVDPIRRWKRQHYGTDVGARSLAHPAGTVETNRARAIQIEILGYARQSNLWTQSMMDFLRDEVVGVILGTVGIKADAVPFHGEGDGFVLASVHSPIRFSPNDWLRFSGVCGHQHVPGNSHWDPGKLDVDYLLEGDDMPSEQFFRELATVAEANEERRHRESGAHNQAIHDSITERMADINSNLKQIRDRLPEPGQG